MSGRILSFSERYKKQQEELNKAYDFDFYTNYAPTQSEKQFVDIVVSYVNNFSLTNIALSKALEEELESIGYYYNQNYTIEDIEYYLLEERGI